MQRIFSNIVVLSWALWFGGHITLFATLGTIFTTPDFDRETQGAFASRLFPMFERMQLILAAIALLGTATWWISSRARLKMVLFTLFSLATVIAVIETTQITPKIETMRVRGERETPEFERTHQMSSRVYMGGAIVLLIAGFILPSAIRSDVAATSPRTSGENPPV
jgi:carbon starvation protein CstA